MKTVRDWGIELIAFDLNGTLLTSEGIPAPVGSQLFKEAAQNGVHIIPATSLERSFAVIGHTTLCFNLG
jgi:hydroxymethylpyrimidine pyrophosphatase-like HAD family hydrolase